ncbi:GFA family protein [Wenzhouxiangella marina]|uniref:Aldehyde-activating protein n=1 Tax=Wenzhouxiangella marina TaxID=1579979 RepID=A0A0K0XUG9_9GAMM|nr:GFA family protein [Wenzhouxiangella marina]AKS41267.1 aldehyde-activating protein [Wenzhouxiangella marina]MBB6086983.1 hypothetical protein [Wenzhouxiangella marina]
MIKGSCCCGAVQFEIDSSPHMLGMCHCSRCRKLGASALAFVSAKDFRITAGLDGIATYKAEPPFQFDRCFCSACGTALGDVFSAQATFPINAHCIDADLALEMSFHEWVADKPSWFCIGDQARQFAQDPHD